MIIEVILYLAILATAYPAGIFLTRLCDDECAKDRRYLLVTIHFLIISTIILVVVNFRITNLMVMIYMILVFSIMAVKGYLKHRD